MAQETRKTEIIEEMRAEEKVVHGIEDRLINLGKYQQYALEQTFGKEFAPRKTFGNLVSFYRALNQSFNLGLFDEVLSLKLACDEFEKEARLSLNDVDERYLIRPKIVDYFRKDLFTAAVNDILMQNPVFCDVRLENGEQSQDYDTIVITRGGVVFFEMRTPDRNVSIDEEGNYISFYYQEARIEKYNLRERMKVDKEFLSGFLEAHGAKAVPIIPIVVFCGKMAYSNLCGMVKTIRDKQIGEFLDEMCSRRILDDDTMRQINSILKEYRNEIPKPSIPCETAFVEAYADLRSKVETKIVENDAVQN